MLETVSCLATHISCLLYLCYVNFSYVGPLVETGFHYIYYIFCFRYRC
jgi:hypothetical protein